MMEAVALREHQEKALEKAEAVIRSGGLVAVPTDTVYGIIGDALLPEAVARLYALKQRPKEKAFPVFVKDIAMARRFAYISDAKAGFLEHVWPGSVTVVFHRKEKLPLELTAGMDTIALRMPNAPFLLALLARVDVPLAQSSANLSGMPSAVHGQDVIAAFAREKQKPDLVIDGGAVPGTPSAIIDLTANEPRLVRSGLMSKKELDALFVRLQGAME